jgi:hypothetical protein
VTTGYARQKREARELLAVDCARLNAAIKTHAMLSGDTLLLARCKGNLSKMKYSNEQVFRSMLTDLIQAGREHQVAIAELGLTVAVLDGIEASLNSYLQLSAQPRQAIVRRETERARLEQRIRDIDFSLKRLDAMAYMLQFEHPDFFSAYSAARTVVDLRARRSSRPGDDPEKE